jgi:acyl carrier protein
MPTIVAPEFHARCGSHEPSAAVHAIYARLRRTMPHLSATLRPDATFAECGGDSLDLVELCCAVDSDYGIRLSLDDLGAVRTMFDLVSLIARRAIRHPSETSS